MRHSSSIRPSPSIRPYSSIRGCPPASVVSPQHEALVQHQTLVQHQALPHPQTLPWPQAVPHYQAPHLQYEAWQLHLSDAPEHTQAAPEQQDNGSCRRCISRKHLRSSSSWALFQVKERRRGTCAGGSRGCGHAPRLCFLPVGALLSCSLTGPRTVSFQIHSRLDISSPSPELRPSLVWWRAGNTQAQGLKGSQGDSRAPAGGRAGDEGGRPQRAPQQHWKDSSDALAHSGRCPA
ncbi:uncharacterized protein LOC122672941 [Cervus elaphus]|uniref:uncharacterized protein LOC122672941 n=1 Tax=Cervus elaphus TaxID=9860 RepID=UPI001CC290DD|nr:uncharacterized protein LOC122672941 [Cervus elaphus]